MAMNNRERIKALDKARATALWWAEKAEDEYPMAAPATTEENVRMARMWADVAQALKVGDHYGDATLTG